MSTNDKIEVLSSSRLLLRLMSLYNKIGVCIGSVKIPDFFVYCVLSLPTFTLALLNVWIALEENFELKMISTSLSGVIGSLRWLITYILLAMKADSIVSTIDSLQEVVEKSK